MTLCVCVFIFFLITSEAGWFITSLSHKTGLSVHMPAITDQLLPCLEAQRHIGGWLQPLQVHVHLEIASKKHLNNFRSKSKRLFLKSISFLHMKCYYISAQLKIIVNQFLMFCKLLRCFVQQCSMKMLRVKTFLFTKSNIFSIW